MSIKPGDLKKNNKVAEQLSRSISEGKLVHAFALTGGSPQDRLELGTWLSQYLFCSQPDDGPCGECLPCRKFLHGNHEDFIHVKKQDDRESIVKDQVLELIDRLSLKPFGSRYVVLVEDAQLMNAASQNKLLKTLEEPVSEAVIILLADREEGLLQTVLSRCVVLRLEDTEGPSASEDAEAAARMAKLIAEGAPFYKKKAVIADIISDKENARKRAEAFLDCLEEELMKMLKASAGGAGSLKEDKAGSIAAAVKHTETGRKYIKQLHSVGYTLKQLCLRV